MRRISHSVQLRSRGLEVIEHAYPDHHVYTTADISYADQAPILMTEKDAVKCTRLLTAEKSGVDVENLWALPVNAIISEPIYQDLIDLIKHRQ